MGFLTCNTRQTTNYFLHNINYSLTNHNSFCPLALPGVLGCGRGALEWACQSMLCSLTSPLLSLGSTLSLFPFHPRNTSMKLTEKIILLIVAAITENSFRTLMLVIYIYFFHFSYLNIVCIRAFNVSLDYVNIIRWLSSGRLLSKTCRKHIYSVCFLYRLSNSWSSCKCIHLSLHVMLLVRILCYCHRRLLPEHISEK